MPPPDLPLNALGLDVPPHAAFFKARNELEEGGPDIDVWSALTNAMQEYQDATAALRLPSVQAGQPSSGLVTMGMGTGVGAGFGIGLGEDVSDEELFAQFIDFPPLPEGDNGTGKAQAGTGSGASGDLQPNAQNNTNGGGSGGRGSGSGGFGVEAPTPELYFPSWTAGDGEDDSDLSPESIRTVGSTSGMIIPGPMGVTPSTGHRHHSDAKPADGKEHVQDEDHGMGQGGMTLLSQSPASGAYNGGLFAWEDYDMSQSAAA
jgi:hypothetical protein